MEQRKPLFPHEPMRVEQLPLFFTGAQTTERRIETGIDGRLLFEPPSPGYVQNARANPNPLPLDFYGTKDVPFVDQYLFPPANMNQSPYGTEPLVFPDKYLHQIIEWR